MRRIALAAALIATLAGGAAALAATPDPGAPDAAPDPYQGAWALTIDGRFAGPVGQVQGCSLKADVMVSPRDESKHIAGVEPEPCTFEAGAGMSSDFYALVDDGLSGAAKLHAVELIRADAPARYGLRLTDAMLSSVTLPKVDRAGTAPVFLEVALHAGGVTRDDAPKLAVKAPVLRGLDPATLQVAAAGQPLGAISAGPWTAEAQVPAAVGQTRESLPAHAIAHIGDLPLRVPQGSKATKMVLDPWVHSALVTGAADAGIERTVSVALGGLALTLDRAAPDRADLVPRADGARSYGLYADDAALAAS